MISPFPFNRLTQNGFSFISVAILLFFLAIGTALLIPALSPEQSTANLDRTMKKIEILQQGIALYRADHGDSAPAQLDHLVTPVAPTCSMDTNTSSPNYRKLQGWCSTYVDRAFLQIPNDYKTDGWGTSFQYDTVIVKSCGPNRVCGDSDDISQSI